VTGTGADKPEEEVNYLSSPFSPEKIVDEGPLAHDEHIVCTLRKVCDSAPSSGLCAPCLFSSNGRVVGCYYIQPHDYLWADDEE
jgi:hypothetical protein